MKEKEWHETCDHILARVSEEIETQKYTWGKSEGSMKNKHGLLKWK